MENLKNKVAVVFAASGKITEAVACSSPNMGKDVCQRTEPGCCKTLVEEIKANGGHA